MLAWLFLQALLRLAADGTGHESGALSGVGASALISCGIDFASVFGGAEVGPLARLSLTAFGCS
jgi:hypothetical protein